MRCSLAEDEQCGLLGFQSLIRATEDNRYGTPVGWGIIGTHVSPDAARTGVGTALFAASRRAAIEAGLTKIEAFRKGQRDRSVVLRTDGFETYRTSAEN
ncbi:GNAT family N-acetyltransferase [Rhizobium sp. NXC14]|uniref:GNAT family N-acetyltransferase n=1 Tax=Rhizobium sp. NXC14 TaxID=1981173 RepID=UPI001FD8C8A6|nr:GNAT family N-acetyltransferase [Rhizobium sp. NXC14]